MEKSYTIISKNPTVLLLANIKDINSLAIFVAC